VETAADYKCQLVVFPEYFTVASCSRWATSAGPSDEQVRDLAGSVERYDGADARALRAEQASTSSAARSRSRPRQGRAHLQQSSSSAQRRVRRAGQAAHDPLRDRGVEGLAGSQRLGLRDDFGRMAITICYDVEFPEMARAAARRAPRAARAELHRRPAGFLRVRYCAHARAIENQMYVVHSCTVGSLPMVPAVSLNYGQAAILTPSDFPFSRDGILAEGIPNQEMMVIGELNLRTIWPKGVRAAPCCRCSTASRSAELAAPRAHVRCDAKGCFRSSATPGPRTSTASSRSARWSTRVTAVERGTARVAPPRLPEGQFVAVARETGRVVGIAASLIILWDDYEFTELAGVHGQRHVHQPRPGAGRTLYGAEVMVHPDAAAAGSVKALRRRGGSSSSGLACSASARAPGCGAITGTRRR
jgi:hypothetical protein